MSMISLQTLRALARRNAEYESDYATAEAAVGTDVAAACQSWAQTTTLPNDHAFEMCWRAGGPEQAECSLIYLDAVGRQVRRLYGV